MSHAYCCVINCKNNGVNSNCKFYAFPKSQHKIAQRLKWIAAVRKVNADEGDESPWNPKPSHLICSKHFIDGKKSDSELSPSYAPTIFSNCNLQSESDRIKARSATARHDRFMKRRLMKSKLTTACQDKQVKNNLIDRIDTVDTVDFEAEETNNMKMTNEIGCQVDFLPSSSEGNDTFTCIIYANQTDSRDVEIQTEIQKLATVRVPNQKQFKDKQCGTPEKTFVDQAVGPSIENDNELRSHYFSGFVSLNHEQLLDLTGVRFSNFQFLRNKLKKYVNSNNSKMSVEDRLLIFLIKIKTGLTFAAISVFFPVHRTTISRIFFSTLGMLVDATKNLVFWPTKHVVQATMPECFKPDYINTRVIIDCTEFRIEIPAAVDDRVYTYSHYKNSFTAKLLIGITPGGFICLKSKVSGGRKSDSQITIESGLIDLLEDGDVVLADKGFPEIRQVIDDKGKRVTLVMPPFLAKKSEFTKEETEETYSIARVRIHVERIMQRLRMYMILHKIPEYLFKYIDDIIHICCVLVNLQPPIFAEGNT